MRRRRSRRATSCRPWRQSWRLWKAGESQLSETCPSVPLHLSFASLLLAGELKHDESGMLVAACSVGELNKPIGHLHSACWRIPGNTISIPAPCSWHNNGKLHCRHRIVGGFPRLTDGSIDYAQDFFCRKAFLTVSGQIQARLHTSISMVALLCRTLPTPSHALLHEGQHI